MVLAPGGLEEREDGETIEYVLYGAPGRAARARRRAGRGRRRARRRLDDRAARRLADWRSFHVPIDVPAACACAPPWEPPLRRRARRRDRARARPSAPARTPPRGSRSSCSTQLEPAGALADWGCGSGVLAIAAAKLGWAPVLACDVEPESVEATRDGAAANGVTVEVTRCDVRQGGPHAPTVLANLVRPLLLEVAANLDARPRPPDHLRPRGRRARRGRPRLRPPRPARGRPPRGGNWSAVDPAASLSMTGAV